MEYITPSFLALPEPSERASAPKPLPTSKVFSSRGSSPRYARQLSPYLARKHFDAIDHLFAHTQWD